HLLCSFLSGFLNRRKDEYGGSVENRIRIVVNIIAEIKKRAGEDFPVGLVLNGVDVKYDRGPDQAVREGVEIAEKLEAAGAASFQIRHYRYGYIGSLWPEQSLYPEAFEPLPEVLDWTRNGAGSYVPLAAAVKRAVSVPVTTVGRMDPELGEKVLRDGSADFIGMCRRLLADPELPNKIREGRPEDIAPCTACLHCLEQVRFHKPMRCRINASLGKGADFEIKKAGKKKTVVVIGGGPAGMEAARVSALRGHDVTLYAKEHKLGGLLPTAALVKSTKIEDLTAFIRYFRIQLYKLGVETRLGKQVDISAIEKAGPDAVVLATGGKHPVLNIPGMDRPNVLTAAGLHKNLKTWQRIF
ncbi:MAG: FAD-dependent oxidoreductase, partial [Desulfobacterales bacterium]|nr:FAD-dependent oxidoreductase [Desulfobacterales bacterium]